MIRFIIFIASLLMSTVVFGQSTNLSEYFSSNKEEPGGILLIKKKDETKSYYHGLANQEKKLPISPDTRFRMASVSKQFTAMAVYLLIQQNKISFDTPIKSIFPEFPPACDSIKVKHLLNHSSGLADYENVIPETQKNQLSDLDVLNLIKGLDNVYFEAGSQFRYSNTAFCLLSLIVERIAVERYGDFCQREIFKKLDMQTAQISAPEGFENRAFGYHPSQSTFEFADQSITSATRGDGGVYISASDFAKWMDQRNSLFNDQFYKDLEFHKIAVKDDVYYSLGFFVTKSSNEDLTLFHSGESTGFHNIMLFQPGRDLGLSLFTNRDDLYIVDIFQKAIKSENIEIPTIREPLFLWLNKVYSGQ